MGSAVSNLVGGGGGGLFSSIGGIAGSFMGGPIGGMIGSALGNLIQSAVGDGIKAGISQLQQEHGMPKFLANALTQAVDKAVGALQNQNVDAGVLASVKDKHSGALESLTSLVKDMFTGGVTKARKEEDGGDGKGGWLQAIAKAMGQTLGDKASKMVELSNKMSDVQGQTAPKNASKEEKAEFDKNNAQEFNKLMTEFQATGQEYSMLNSVFSTAIKSIGEAMSSMARKQ